MSSPPSSGGPLDKARGEALLNEARVGSANTGRYGLLFCEPGPRVFDDSLRIPNDHAYYETWVADRGDVVGISPKAVQVQLGHSDLSMTLRYTKVLPELAEAAARRMEEVLADPDEGGCQGGCQDGAGGGRN